MKDSRGNDTINIVFAKADCSQCPYLSQRTKAKTKRRTINVRPQEQREALQSARLREKTKEFKDEYCNRAGIEGSISQAVRAFGLRNSRYVGMAKTRLQRYATAAAINPERVADWFAEIGREKTLQGASPNLRQSRTRLIGAFAAMAMLLAAVGVFSLLAYLVGQRTKELAIRRALGAKTIDVIRLVVGQGLRLVAIGLAVGLAGAITVARLLEKLLFGISPWDFNAYLGAITALGIAAVLAILLPAIRAAAVDPLIALRHD